MNVSIFLLDRIVLLKESPRQKSMLTPVGDGKKRSSIVCDGSWLDSIALRLCPYFMNMVGNIECPHILGWFRIRARNLHSFLRVLVLFRARKVTLII